MRFLKCKVSVGSLFKGFSTSKPSIAIPTAIIPTYVIPTVLIPYMSTTPTP
jgi:hypothetical protein